MPPATRKEDDMNAARAAATRGVPKRRQRHYSYDESVDEPPGLIEDEPVAIESEKPAEDARPVENLDESGEKDPPAFEE
jgi:hypothetical protein